MAIYIYSAVIGLGFAILSFVLMILAIGAERSYGAFLAVLIASLLLAIYGLASADTLHTERRREEIAELIAERDANWMRDNF